MKNSNNQVWAILDTSENGYTLRIQARGGDVKSFVFHSLSEVMRRINNEISGMEMGPIYHPARTISTDPVEYRPTGIAFK